jgi:hypothetical protein
MPEAAAPALGNILVLAEELDRQAHQVVEIHRLVGAQGALVVGIEFRRRAFDVVGGIRQSRLGLDQLVLPQRNA